MLFQLAGWRSRRRLSILQRMPLSEAVAVWERPSYSLVCKQKLHCWLHHPFREGEIWLGGFLRVSLAADAPSSVTTALHPDTSLRLSPGSTPRLLHVCQKKVSPILSASSAKVHQCLDVEWDVLSFSSSTYVFFFELFEAHQAGKFLTLSHVLSAAAVASSILIVLVIGTGVWTNP